MKNKSIFYSVGILVIILLILLINIYSINVKRKGLDTNDNYINTSNNSNNIDTTVTTTNTTRTTITTTTRKRTTTTKRTTRESKQTTQRASALSQIYKLTHYGPDCSGCSGTTASGYNVRNTIYYNDNTYGKIRVVAMKDLPLYSVIKIKNYKQSGDIIAIVLDKPKNYGIIDLLVESEKKSSQLGIQNNVQIEILRRGK